MNKTRKTLPMSAKALTIMLSPMLAGSVAAGAASTITCGAKQIDVPMAGRTTVVISTSPSAFNSIGSFSTELPSTGAVVSVTGDFNVGYGTNVEACFNVAAEGNSQCTIVFDTSAEMPNAFFSMITDINGYEMTCDYTALPVELETFEIE